MSRPTVPADGELIIHSDGSSLGNPGPGGIGVVIRDADGHVLAEISENIGETTNNVAEYRAAIAGLRRARELGAGRVLLRADSELMIKQIKREYRVKNANLKPLYAELMDAAGAFVSFRCEHVRRELNAHADELANRASAAG